MKKAWQTLGTIAFWTSWPLIYLYLAGTQRSKILVIAEGRVLVVKSWLGPGSWSLPGGGLHRGEEPLDGVLRELQEETGLSLPGEQVRPLFSGVVRQHGLSVRYRCFVLQLPEVLALRPQRFEITDAQWLTKSQLATASQDVRAALDAAGDMVQ